MSLHATIPMKNIGPIKIKGPVLQEEIMVPLATYETPLWPSTHRGALISKMTDGILVTVIHDKMTRSIVMEGPDAVYLANVAASLKGLKDELQAVVLTTSRFATLEDWHTQIVGNLLFIRFELSTGDAAGHNMVTKASEALQEWILKSLLKINLRIYIR